MENSKPKKWLIEVTDQQLADIINCVEDCCRFACGQTEMWNTTAYIGDIDTHIALREELDKLHNLVAPELGYGGSYGWNGGSCPHPAQRKFIARNYGVYRHLRHLRTILEDHANDMNVYNSETLTCEEQGELPKLTPYVSELKRLEEKCEKLDALRDAEDSKNSSTDYQELLWAEHSALQDYIDAIEYRELYEQIHSIKSQL